MNKFYRTIFSIIIIISSFSAQANNKISFQCSWDKNKSIKILVNPERMTATRNDGGKNYNVIKLTKYVVWLEVYEPSNQAGLKIQMIQRAKATNNKAGKWIDVVFSMSGAISPIEGGLCWEQ